MSKIVYTGMWTFARPGATDQHFGSADAVSSPGETGKVRLSLDLRQVAVRIEDAFVYVELPEEWAKEIVGVLGGITLRLQHLRELHKLGLLAPDAMHDDKEQSESPVLLPSQESPGQT